MAETDKIRMDALNYIEEVKKNYCIRFHQTVFRSGLISLHPARLFRRLSAYYQEPK
jgi:hypothetical protein